MALPAASRLPFTFTPPSSAPGSVTNLVRAGLRAGMFENELQAEHQADQQALQQQEFMASELDRQDRSLAKQSAELKAAQRERLKAAERASQEAKSLDVTRATLEQSVLPSKMTETDRGRAERELKDKDNAPRANAAAELRAEAESSPYKDETEGGFLGFGGQPTARAKEVQDRLERLNDPAALTEDDLAAYRKKEPEALREVDALRTGLTKDDEAREAHQSTDLKLARAKAIAGGLSPDEADLIATPAAADPVEGRLRSLAVAGKLEREGTQLQNRAAALDRQRGDADQLAARLAEVEDVLRKGGNAAQLMPFMAQRERLMGEHAAMSATLSSEAEAYNASVRAHETRRQMLQERLTTPSAPAATPAPASGSKPAPSVEEARQQARRLPDGAFETNDPANLQALTEAQEKVFWTDPATPATPEARAAATKTTHEALDTLREVGARTSQGLNDAVEKVEQRVRSGDLAPEAALREREKAITDYEAKFEQDSAVVSRHLSDALQNFAAGKIDAETLNAAFHAAGHPQTGVERFAEVQADLRKDQEHVTALESLILGEDAGRSDPSLNGTELSLLADLTRWQDIATRNGSGDLSTVSQNEFGFGTTAKGVEEASANAQKKADSLKAQLTDLRQTRRAKLANELVRRGVDAGDVDRLIAEAELRATEKASPGIAALIASRGGLLSATGEKLPFAGGVVESARLLPYAMTALRLEEGQEVPAEDLEALSSFVRFASSEPGFWTKAADGITELPGFAVELYTTAGVAGAVKAGGMKVLKEALLRAATKQGRKQLAEVMARSSADNVAGAWAKNHAAKNVAFRIGSGLVQEAARLPVASSSRVLAHFTEDTALQGMSLSPQEGRLVAVIDHPTRHGTLHRVADAVVDSYIENVSERTGGLASSALARVLPQTARESLKSLSNAAKGKLLSAVLVKSLVARNPQVPLGNVQRFLKTANIGGVFEEMLEERVGGVARDAWKGLSTNEWGLTLPTAEDLAVEFLTFLVPGAANTLSTHRHFSTLDRALQDSDRESTDHLEGLASDAATHAVRLSEQAGSGIDPAELERARELIGPLQADDTLRAIDRTQLDLMERAESALLAGDLTKASRLKQMALAHSRTRSTAADAAVLQGVQSVREITHARTRAAERRTEAEQLAATDPAAADAMAIQAEQMEQAAHRAAAIVKIARGREASLTVAETAALQTAATPAVVDEGGGSIITDSAREELAALAPTAARYVKQSESMRREQLSAAVSTVPGGGGVSPPASSPSSTGNPPAPSASPTTGLWTGKGTKGTRLSLEASLARSPQEAMEKMAAQLPHGEDFDGASLMPPPRSATTTGISRVSSSAGVPPASATSPSSDLKVWRAVADSDVRASLPRASQAQARRVLDELETQLRQYGKLFARIERRRDLSGSGMELRPATQDLLIDVPAFIQNVRGVGEADLARQVQALVEEEVSHRVITEVVSNAEAGQTWSNLGATDAGKTLQQDVIRAYFAALEARGQPLPTVDQLEAWRMGHEMLRMFFQDEAFAGRLTEAAAVSPSLKENLRNFLRALSDFLRKALRGLPQDQRQAIQAMLDKARARAIALGIPITGGTGVSPVGSGGAGVSPEPLSAKDARVTTGAAAPALLPEGKGIIAIGQEDTLYTSTGEPILFRWIVVEASDLIPSHDLNGKPKAGFPQALQPRQQTRADGLNNATVRGVRQQMNYALLSDAPTAREGAPVVDAELHVEGGNGRTMGMQAAYLMDASQVAANYKADLLADAAAKGLDPQFIQAAKAPVLVRQRLTPVDAVAFAEDTNRGGSSRMTPREQAIADARNLSPDSLASLEVSEDGDLFSAGNLGFFRDFFRQTVSREDLDSLLADGATLNQAALSRVRSALFVAAYGDSETALSAFYRLAEAVDDDPARNLSRALISAAPAFARLNVFIRDKARHNLSIADELAQAAGVYSGIKERGETVASYLAQGDMLSTVPPLVRDILRFIEANKLSAKKLGGAMRGYAASVEGLGDPRQVSMFDAEPPSKAALWHRAAQATLAAAPRADLMAEVDEGLRYRNTIAAELQSRLRADFHQAVAEEAANGYPDLPGFMPMPNLPRHERVVEAYFAQYIADDPARALARYEELAELDFNEDGLLPPGLARRYVSADLARHILPEYERDPRFRMLFDFATVAPAGYVALRLHYNRLLRERRDPNVTHALFLAGGVASGKTTVAKLLLKELLPNSQIIFDSTLRNPARAAAMFAELSARGLEPKVYFVFRPWSQVVPGAINRLIKSGRPVDAESSAATHHESQTAFLTLAAQYPGHVTVVANDGTLLEIRFESIDFLEQRRYDRSDETTRERLAEAYRRELDRRAAAGEVSGLAYAAAHSPRITRSSYREIAKRSQSLRGEARPADASAAGPVSGGDGATLAASSRPNSSDSSLDFLGNLFGEGITSITDDSSPSPDARRNERRRNDSPSVKGRGSVSDSLGELFDRQAPGSDRPGQRSRRRSGHGLRADDGPSLFDLEPPVGSQPKDAGGKDDQPLPPDWAGHDRAAQDLGAKAPRARPGLGTPERNLDIPADTVDLAPRSNDARMRANIAALRLLRTLEVEQRNPTPEEKAVLVQFSGWGWNKEMFNPDNDRYRAEHTDLKELLSEEEFRSAAASSLFSHYTAPQVIKAMWDAARHLGFNGGTVIEPAAGIGHFFGMMPADLVERSKQIGVELDRTSGAILRKLYPEADIRVEGFQDALIANNSADLVITNVPFDKTAPYDPAYDVPGIPTLNLHNYFLAKSLDKVRPGGLVIAISTAHTMQSHRAHREYLATRGELVGALRLPNDAFKGNANTSVTTDILFLRKPNGAPSKGQPWVNLEQAGEATVTIEGETVTKPVFANEYFVAHPGMALGEHTLAGTMYRPDEYALISRDGQDTAAELARAIADLPANVLERKSPDTNGDSAEPKIAGRDAKEGSYLIDDDAGSIMQVEIRDHIPVMVKADLRTESETSEVDANGKVRDPVVLTEATKAKREAIARGYIRIREAVKRQIELELNPGATDEAIESQRRALYAAYTTFRGKFGTLNHATERYSPIAFLEDDPEHALVLSLEDEKTVPHPKKAQRTQKLYIPGAILKKRVLAPAVMPERAENVNDAVLISMGHIGRIDIPAIAQLLGITEEQAQQRVTTSEFVFVEPGTGSLLMADEYLTGNVRAKLRAATSADSQFKRNVEALLQVQPPRAVITEISAPFGSRWVPSSAYSQFVTALFGSPSTVRYRVEANDFSIRGSWNSAAGAAWSVGDFSPHDVLGAALLGKTPRITQMVKLADGTKTTQENEQATALARAKVNEMRERWETWLLETSAVHKEVEDAYNEKINHSIAPRYSGGYLTLPGLSKDVFRLPHRLRAVAKVIQSGGGMLAHGVGSGKTFTLIAAAMEMRRLGRARKPVIVVQKATIGQFAASFRRAYPNARVLVATEKTFAARRRAQFFSRIATNEWDAVIVTQPQMDLIRSHPKTRQAYIADKLSELEDIMHEAKENGDQTQERIVQQRIRSLQKKLDAAMDSMQQRGDTTLWFEQLGIDALLIDEAHAYKRLPIISNMQSIRGIPTGESERAMNLEMAVHHIHSRTGGRNIVLATGTPVTNTMAEVYVMLKLSSPHVLRQFDIYNFDDFATTFGRVSENVELGWGNSYKLIGRFNKFINGRELTTMIRSGFDVAMGNEELGLKVPAMEGGKPQVIISEATQAQEQFNDWVERIASRFESLEGKEKKEWTYIPIVTMQAGMAAALDPRLINPSAPDEPGSKVNECVRRTTAIYRRGMEKKTTQLIFADRFKPINVGKLEAFESSRMGRLSAVSSALDALDQPNEELDEEAAAAARGRAEDAAFNAAGFNLYHDLKEKLIAQGIPAQEIAIIHEFNTDRRRAELFDALNAGEIRIVIGSTEKLGVGVNMQERLAAMHHLDPPRSMTPAMVEQRDGRGIRQGNLHYVWAKEAREAALAEGKTEAEVKAAADRFAVANYRYATRNSMDAGIIQLLESKQRFITQALKGYLTDREFSDPADEATMSFAEMRALATGDDRILRQVKLKEEVRRLKAERDGFLRQRAETKMQLNEAQQLRRIRERQLPLLQQALADYGQTFKADVHRVTSKDGDNVTGKDEIREWLAGVQANLSKFVIGGGTEKAVSFKYNGFHVRLISSLGARSAEGTQGIDISMEVYHADDLTDSLVTSHLHEGYTVMQALGQMGRTLESQVQKIRSSVDELQSRIPALEEAVTRQWGKADLLASMEADLAKINASLLAGARKKEEGKALRAPVLAQSFEDAVEEAALATLDARLSPRGRLLIVRDVFQAASTADKQLLSRLARNFEAAGATSFRTLVGATLAIASLPDSSVAPVSPLDDQKPAPQTTPDEKTDDHSHRSQRTGQGLRDPAVRLAGADGAIHFGPERQRTRTTAGEAPLAAQPQLGDDTLAASPLAADLEAAIAELRADLPSPAYIADLNRRAGFDSIETDLSPEEVAQLADSKRIGLEFARDQRRAAETHHQWNEQAREMIATDRDGVLRALLQTAQKGGQITNAVQVKACQILLPDLMRRAVASRNSQAMQEAETLAWAYDIAGTETARSLTARWQPHRSAEERHREMIAKMIFTPNAAKRKEIDQAPSPAMKAKEVAALEAELNQVQETARARIRELEEAFRDDARDAAATREQLRRVRAQATQEVAALKRELTRLRSAKDKLELLHQANEQRLAQIEEALADMGVTLSDLFVSKEAIIRLRGSSLVKNALEPFNAKERLAMKLRMEGHTDRQISDKSGISRSKVPEVSRRFDTALEHAIGTWVDRGFSLSDFELLDTAGNIVGMNQIIDDAGNLRASNFADFEPSGTRPTAAGSPQGTAGGPDQMLDTAGNIVSLDSVVDDQGNLRAAVRAASLSADDRSKRIAEIMRAIVPSDRARKSGTLKRREGAPTGEPFGFDLSRPEHAVRIARAIQAVDGTAMDMIYEYWINGILSGPATHVANVVGNTANIGLEYLIQRPLEAITNILLGADPAGATLGEYKAIARYSRQAFADALHYARMAWLTEASLFEQQWSGVGGIQDAGGLKGEGPRAAIKGTPGRIIRIPTRALLYADEFAKRFVGRIEAAAQAHRLGIAQGFSGAALDSYIAAQVKTPGSTAWLAALDKAKEMTFQQDLPEFLEKVQRLKGGRAQTWWGAVLKLAFNLVFPFVKTPYNIFATGLRKTPLGSVKMAGKAGMSLWKLKEGKPFFDSYPRAALARDIAEQLLGWTAMLVLAGMTEGDPDDESKLILITGTRNRDDKAGEGQLLNRARGGETAILWRGKPVFNYGRYEPFSTAIVSMVNAMRQMKSLDRGRKAGEVATAMLGDFVDSARSKTFLSGFDGLMRNLDALGDENGNVTDKVMKFLVTGVVPNLVRQPLRNIDDHARDTRNASLAYHALPLGGLAEPLYDLYGRPVQKEGNPLLRILISEPTAVPELHPADRALLRWNAANPLEAYHPANPTSAMFRFKDRAGKWHTMTPQQIAEFRRIAGQDFDQAARIATPTPAAPTAETIDNLRDARNRSFRKTKEKMFFGGAPPVAKSVSRSLREIFGSVILEHK